MTTDPIQPVRRPLGSLRARLLLGFTIVFSLAFAGVAAWVTSRASALAEEQIATDLENTLVQGAAHIDGDTLQALYQDLSTVPECATPPGLEAGAGYYPDDPRYWEHVQWLETIHTIEPRAYTYTFILGDRPKEMIFIGSNGATWEPKDGAPFCYHFIAHHIVRPTQGLVETTLALRGYTDQWGHWITGYTPITNAQGEAVAALGVDFKADDIIMARQKAIRPLVLAFIISYGVMGLLLLVVSGFLTRPIRMLTGAARHIGERVPSPELKALQQPGYGSEIATLARVLEETSIRRQQAEAAIEEQRNLAETLTRTAEIMTSTLDLDAVLNRILRLTRRIVANDGAAIALGASRASMTVTLYGLGQTEAPGEASRRLTIPAQEAQPLWDLVESLETGIYDQQASFQPWRETLNLNTSLLKSGVVTPIVIEDRIVGVIFLGSSQPDFYTDADAQRLKAFANQAAIAIANAWLAQELTEKQQELRLLSARLIDSQEHERKHIAQALHDAMGQMLAAIDINLATVLTEMPPDVLGEFEDRLTESRELANDAVNQVREMILDLRPIMLDDLGLIPTARWYVQAFARRLNIEAVLDLQDDHERLPAEIETGLYRCVQETLTNIARHADARHLLVSLHWDEQSARLFIEDDGQGFDNARVTGDERQSYGLGLLGIEERVTALDGTFQITSTPGQGTETLIVIPLDDGARRPGESTTSDQSKG